MDTRSLDPAAALRRAGLRVTAPRLAVLTVLAARTPHASVDTLVNAVRERLGDGSAQTVYNVLRTLADAGLVRRIEPAGRPGLYELRVGDNHHHIVCRSCEAIADVECAVGEAPCLTAVDNAGYEIDEAEVIYWGRCPGCVAAELGAPDEASRTRSDGLHRQTGEAAWRREQPAIGAGSPQQPTDRPRDRRPRDREEREQRV